MQITISKPWPYRHPSKGRRVADPGLYNVPADLPEVVARRAVAEGMAQIVASPLLREPERPERAEKKPAGPILKPVPSDWDGFCIVAATGPSLTPKVADLCRGHRVIAVNDAYRLMPWAELLYACDEAWWAIHEGCPDFAGERWSSHGDAMHNNKLPAAEKYGLNLVRGSDERGFSTDPKQINYGGNSGFQAVNMALHKIGWKGRVALVGFDMRKVDGKAHFFGDHPKGLTKTRVGYVNWPKAFAKAAKELPATVEIVNCTQGSAMTCFPMMELSDALPDPA